MEKIKAHYVIGGIFAVKMITYYCLIGVNIFDNIMVMGSVGILAVLFIALADGGMKWKKLFFFISYIFLSVIMFADTMYYNYYNQTVSVKQLWQVSNVAKVPSSFIATLIPASFILILDIPFICYYFKKRAAKEKEGKRKPLYMGLITLGCVLLIAVNPMQSVLADRLNSVEFFTGHVNDIYRAVLSSGEMSHVSAEEVLETVQENVEEPAKTKLKGIAEGKNLILIQVEALQNFLIGQTYNGQEITPNLNQLLIKDTLYFDRYYATIGKGNTVDAEFATLNSLYPVIDAECYRLYQENAYNGLPWLLKDKGYSTFAVHGYEGDFWNRNNAYPYQGIDEYYSMEDLEQDEIIGLGISDKSMFRQTLQILKEQKQPFFSFLVTLTNHHPYLLEEAQQEIRLLKEHEGTKFGSYLQTAHYTDEAIGDFIEQLKAEGLYDNTVIALYGDHHGLNSKMDNNEEYMSKFLGREYDYDEMLRVPLMIHIPGSGTAKTISTLGGHIDFLPTIANLMNLETAQPYVLGQDLVNAESGFAAFTAYLFEGSYVADDIMFEISREGTFEGSRAWEIGTGVEKEIEQCREDYEKALALKAASKNILEQNLISEYITREVVPYMAEEIKNPDMEE